MYVNACKNNKLSDRNKYPRIIGLAWTVLNEPTHLDSYIYICGGGVAKYRVVNEPRLYIASKIVKKFPLS